jgi:ATP-dependent RNA helicase DeaD
VVPPALRGGNLVAVLPPVPAWGVPVLAGLLGQLPAKPGSILILATPASLGEWTLAAGALVEGTSLQVDTAWDGEGASVRTAARRADLVIASPESALARHVRSALHADGFRAVLFAWPEEWAADESVAALLQDFPKDSQRIVLTSRRDLLDGADSVVERYARKAVVVAPAIPAPVEGAPPKLSVRTVATSWSGRAATVAAVAAALDTAALTIWTADERDHQLIRRTLGSLRAGLRLETRRVPGTGTLLCYDLPSPQQLAELSVVGEVVLLVTPGTESYVAALAPTRRPMAIRSATDAIRDRDAQLRHEVADAIDHGDLSAALYALAPLFEQYDAQNVAAAVFGLWRAQAVAGSSARTYGAGTAPGGPTVQLPRDRAPAPPISTVRAGVAPVAKLWIGAGKKDEATVADFVAVLVREVGLERGKIGRIELRDTFALVEVPAAEAEAIALRLSGITIRKRKLTARVDAGPGGSERPRAKARVGR